MRSTVKGVTTATAAPRPASLLAGRYRATTTGLVLVVTLVAFEALAVATAMPTAVRELNGLAYYSWPFTAFLVSSVVAMVLAGQRSDRRGPRGTLLAGLAVFAAGLVVAGTAHLMAVFVAGRAVQGLGAGAIIVAIYVVIAEVYDEDMRPRVFAAISAAWVLPSLVGPLVSGLLTEHLTWRLVFTGMVPFVLLGLVLVLPSLTRLPARDRSAVTRRRRLAPFAVLAAVGLAGLQYAGQHPRWATLPVALLALAALVPALRRLLPPGTLTLRRGLPASLGYRGLLAGAFFGADTFVPLTLTQVHGYGAAAAGAPLIAGALGWFGGSWWQARRSDPARYRLVRAGCALISLSTAGLVLVAWPGPPGWLAAPLWVLAGFGMGISTASISVLMLGLSPADERGANGAALQICDVLASATLVGLGGVLLTAVASHGGSLPVGLTLIDLVMAAVAAVGVALAGRLRVRGNSCGP
jgi:MFS family permease